MIDGILKNEGLKNEKIIQVKGAKNPENSLNPHDVNGIIALMKGGWLLGDDPENSEVPEGVIYITASSKGTGMLENISAPNLNIFYLEDFDWFFRNPNWISRVSSYFKKRDPNQNSTNKKLAPSGSFDDRHLKEHKENSFYNFVTQGELRGLVISPTSTQKGQMIWDNAVMAYTNPRPDLGIHNLQLLHISKMTQLFGLLEEIPMRGIDSKIPIKIGVYPGSKTLGFFIY